MAGLGRVAVLCLPGGEECRGVGWLGSLAMISIRALCPLDKGFGGREQDWTCSGQGVGTPVLCAEMPLAFLKF